MRYHLAYRIIDIAARPNTACVATGCKNIRKQETHNGARAVHTQCTDGA